MESAARGDTGEPWGPAEQAAIDRCLTVPGLSERGLTPTRPIRLSRTIEAEIIPRLMLAHLPQPGDARDPGEPRITPADIADFARIVLALGQDTALAHVEALRARGHGLEAIFLDLLAPTARLLGDMWRDDLCSFADTTIGLSRLQQILRALSPTFESEPRPDGRGRILLGASPGEQHSFGLSMLESFFRRAGWDVCGGAGSSADELAAFARDEWLDAIGLSLSSDVLVDRLRTTISLLRSASRNRSVFVMVGGRYFVDHPDHAAAVGADAAASDAPDALRRADVSLGFTLARC